MYRDFDKKFTFALVYDELQIYNICQQTNNPMNEEAQKSYNYNVTGYNPIRISGKVNDYCTWGGLVLTTYIDGCPGGASWFYSIGYTGAHWQYTGYIPSNIKPVNYVTLWVKVPIPEIFNIGSCKYQNYLSIHSSYFHVMIILYL